MRKLNLLAAIALVSLAGGAAAAAGETSAKPAKEKKICKGEDHSETRIARKRVCKTEREWARDSSPEGRNAVAKDRRD